MLWNILFHSLLDFQTVFFQLQKNEKLLNNANKEACSCMQGGDGETGDMARSPFYSIGQQGETQRRLKRRHKSGTDGGIEFVFTLTELYVIQLGLIGLNL